MRPAAILPIILLTAALATPVVAAADDAFHAEADRLTRTIARDLGFLASPEVGGRSAGSRGDEVVTRYLQLRFAEIGLAPPAGGWFQPVALGDAGSRNVIGVLPGASDELVVIGAHHDHLGIQADRAGNTLIHVGADDNASGVALLLAFAELLARREAPPQRTVVFVAFAAEELGLRGAKAMVAGMPVAVERIVAMINLDMVGHLSTGGLLLGGLDTSPAFAPIMGPSRYELLAPMYGLPPVEPAAMGIVIAGDQQPFYEAGIPFLFLHTGPHEFYHRPGDTAATIDTGGIAALAYWLLWQGWRVMDGATEVTFQALPTGMVGAGGASPRPYLGTIPDFTFQGEGVRLTGAQPGSPADGHVQPGDLVVGLDDAPIAGLADYATLLRAHQAGDEVTLILLRDGQRIECRLVLGRRGE